MNLSTSGWISLLALVFSVGSGLLTNLQSASTGYHDLDKRIQILQIQIDRLDR